MTFTPTKFVPSESGGLDKEFKRQQDLLKESQRTAEEEFDEAQKGLKTAGEVLYNVGKAGIFLFTGGKLGALDAIDALRNKIEGKPFKVPTTNPTAIDPATNLITSINPYEITSESGTDIVSQLKDKITSNSPITITSTGNVPVVLAKGESDPTGQGSERFLFGEDVFANLPEANRKALAKLGITDNESKLFISKYNNIGRDSAGAVESVFTTYNDFEKTKSAVFPFFAEEMKNVTQTKTPQLDHVAQLVASLGFFDGQPVKYWPEIAKIVVNEGVFGLGHDPNNLKYLAFDVHTVKSNFWRDNIGDAGEKFFKGRDLSTLPKLRAAAREYAAIIRKSNKLVETANAQYKLLNKTDISQAELEEFISRLGSDPLQSKYNIKQVKSILKQMEEDGFLVKPKTSQAKEERVIKSEQKVTKDKKTRRTKIDQEFQKSVVESETYRKYYASDVGKFKSPLVKGSKDDMLITHAEDIYEEMSINKDPKAKAAIIKKIMKIIKPRYNG